MRRDGDLATAAGGAGGLLARLPRGSLYLLYLISAAAAAGAFVLATRQPEWQLPALRLLAFLLLSSVPAWLYLRFLSVKAGALWNEYVLNLHRLGVDSLEHLPRPPAASIYFRPWVARHRAAAPGPADPADPAAPADPADPERESVYEDKFVAYYGRSGAAERDFFPGAGSHLPVLLAGIVFSLGWASILLDPAFLAAPSGGVGDVLRFAFLGAYVFGLQMLVRRYFQNDLRSGAYLNAVARVVLVAALVLVIHQVWPDRMPGAELATAFLVGFFPLVGQQLLAKLVASRLRQKVQSLDFPYPLSRLDGMNIWYEARLLEEGVEDLQNLATANLVDVILHTRVPVGRLVDWVDQAVLLLHLEPHPDDDSGRTRPRTGQPAPYASGVLRRYGVRTATDLEEIFRPAPRCRTRPEAAALLDEAEDAALRAAFARLLGPAGEPGPSVVHCLLKSFEDEPNLVYVRNWKRDWRGDRPVTECLPA